MSVSILIIVVSTIALYRVRLASEYVSVVTTNTAMIEGYRANGSVAVRRSVMMWGTTGPTVSGLFR